VNQSNLGVAESFNEIADLLEIMGQNPFKVRAYRRAAEAIAGLDEPALALLARDPGAIPGIGESLRAKVEEMESCGRIEYLERLRAEVPSAILALIEVPGIGPKTAWKLYESLGVEDEASLLAAARAQKIRSLPGFGEKTEANIIKAIENMKMTEGRRPLYSVMPIADKIAVVLSEIDGAERVGIGGSLRRRRDTVGDIDLIVSTRIPDRILEAFSSMDVFSHITAKGSTKAEAVTDDGIKCELRAVAPESYWTGLHHITGSKAHHVKLRGIAGRHGLKISEYGISRDDTGEMIHVDSEEKLYAILGMEYIPPELREDRGEIEAAIGGTLPRLIDVDTIRGDIHMHTDWSDGLASIEEMAEAARNMGYEYIAITDHSRSLGVAHGLSEERLREHINAVRRADAKIDGIRILSGAEVDILKEGRLDYPDELLARLDVVIASIHSGFQQDRDTITSRIIQAMRNPNVDILAHPTGRLLGRRPGYAVDMEAVIREAADTGTALEINSYPDRLDLRDEHARMARESGVMIAINTDAHSPDELENIKYGVWVGRRAWLEPHNVVNAMDYEELVLWLDSHKRHRSQT
jgi:DNA polymerase (family 10)